MINMQLQLLIRDSNNYYVKGDRSHYAIWKINNRNFFENIKKYDIDIVNQTGVYILVGEEKNICYIGETDRLNQRIKEHFVDKDWISDIFLIFSEDKGNKLDKDSARYIENKVISNLKKNPNVEMKNKQNEYNKKLGYAKSSTLDEELKIIFFYLKILEPKIFNPNEKIIKDLPSQISNNKMKIYIKDDLKNVVQGIFNPMDESIIILKNQIFQLRFKKHYLDRFDINSIFKKYNKFVEREHIKDSIYKVRINENIWFKSPSGASNFIKGQNTNGWDHWKCEDDNKTIKNRFKIGNNS